MNEGVVSVEAASPSKASQTDQTVSHLLPAGIDCATQAELDRLRAAFVDLKAEVETLKDATDEGIPVRHRGISLRILKDQIDRSHTLDYLHSDSGSVVLLRMVKLDN